jgi:protein arginine N-methyltransferase 1
MAAALLFSQADAFSAIPRRSALEQIQSISIQPFIAVGASSLLPSAARAKEAISTPISAQWTAVDGLNSLSSDKQFVSFSDSAYKAMMDDPSRTPQFERAIINRLNSAPEGPNSQVVLDLGTGPFALFAIIAAQNGAGKVYAIEANKEAAALARETVKKKGYEDKITILEGFSTDVSLPDGIKADFVVAEIVGSISTEEGAYATVLDARRFLKNPSDANSWIPNRIQTYASPASYTLHNLFVPPAFDWSKLNGEPVRFNCRDEGLQLLSDPVLIEDIDFSNPKVTKKKDVTFTVDGARIDKNELAFHEEFKRGRLPNEEVEKLGVATAHSFSGIALWPRLLLESSTEINSRQYPEGGHQRSHWQTVLPIMSDTPVEIKGGDEVKVTFDFDVSDRVTQPARYRISGNVISNL